MARLAAVDGKINEKERHLLHKMAEKLDIGEENRVKVLKDPSKYPIEPMNSRQERLERLHDLFRIIFADNQIDPDEVALIRKYAVGLGCNARKADQVIRDSIDIFGGNISLDDYMLLMNRD